MANVLVSTKNMAKEEWLAWRRKGIGGSGAAVACGLSRYKSPVELWMDKTGQLEPQEVTSEAAYWGTLLEPLIRVEFTQRTNLQIKHQHQILQHPKYPFMLANLDGIVTDPFRGKCVFEAKTTNAFNSADWLDHIPEEYQLQVQHYLAVTNFAGAYIAVLIELEKRFWHHIETKTTPPFDGSDASSELLSRLYPHGNKVNIDLHGDALPLITQYEQASQEEEAAEERKNEAANKLKALLGENESGFVGDRTVTWKTISSERLNTKLLRDEQPEIHAKYLSTSSSRRFSIK
ncbi:YqaJ viral recombinase family protein [Desulfosporosinus sp. SB140]|uniref:YqaJ viral recombinase family nuclease n=1 Tax=Desulfosporosinus paludis TaxID=3115649 RepID=UPI00388F2DC0